MSRRLRQRQACFLPVGHPDRDDDDDLPHVEDADEPAFDDDGDWAADLACDRYEQELDARASQ